MWYNNTSTLVEKGNDYTSDLKNVLSIIYKLRYLIWVSTREHKLGLQIIFKSYIKLQFIL